MAGDANGDGADLTRTGELDGAFLRHVGTRIRDLRKSRSETVQQLAERAGISRRLMTQIELGQANPSLVTVTRIARLLGTEFTALLEDPTSLVPIEVHDAQSHTLIWTSDAGSTAHLLAATDQRTADLWLWHLSPGDTYRGQPDPARSEELFLVLSGSLTLTADDLRVVVAEGGSARLRSDRPYTYSNNTTAPVDFVRTVALYS